MTDDRWLSTKEIQDRYPIGRSRLYMVLEDGSLRSVRWGRKYLVKTSALEEFLEANEHTLYRN